MIWTINNTLEDALSLPEGRIAANVGFWVEQSVQPDLVIEAAQALIDANFTGKCATQAAILVASQQQGLTLQTWGDLRVM